MAKNKKSKYYKFTLRVYNGLKRIIKRSRAALVTGVLASFAFLIVDGFVSIFPDWLTGPTKIIIGVAGIVILSLIGLGEKKR